MSSNASSNPTCLKRPCDHDESHRKIRKLNTIHQFNEIEISVLVDNTLNIWFKVNDVLKALEIYLKNSPNKMEEKFCKTYDELNSSSDGKYKNILNIHQDTKFINEIGINLFVIQFEMPKGDDFLKWVNNVVIPSIRNRDRHEVNKQHEELQNQNTHLEWEAVHLKSVHTDHTSTSTYLESEIECLKSVQNDLESENTHLKSVQNDLESEISHLKSVHADQTSKLADLESENAHLKTVNADQASKMVRLECEIGDLTFRQEKLQSQDEYLRCTVEHYKSLQEDLEFEIVRLKSAHADLATETARSKSLLADLESENATLKRHLFRAESENVEVEHEKKRLCHAIGRLSDQNDDRLDRLRAVARRVVDMQPSCVPELLNRHKMEYFIVVKKTAAADTHPYYAFRVQEANREKRFRDVKERHGAFRIVQMFETPNSVAFFNRVKQDLGHLIERKGQSFRLADDVTETRMKEEFQRLRDAGQNDVLMKSIRSILSGGDEKAGKLT